MPANEARLRKLLALQDKRWKFETARSARLHAVLADLQAQERRLLALLEGHDVTAPLVAELTLRRLSEATKAKLVAADDFERQTRETLELGRRVKQLEELAERAAQREDEENAARTRREILDLLQQPFEVSAP
jgi:PHD/YefM family antitoxin component YafN of YafNO toxin-antitoxin module